MLGAKALQLVRQQRSKPKARDEELIRLVGEVLERPLVRQPCSTLPNAAECLMMVLSVCVEFAWC